ncbi:SigE family RNA polymerase sigma factor [Nocardioides sp. W7]|uniref:SigE family RNA polymerase sigma factor n=1 Tax=Nocardioides sp. W7 TaxID=2931390 RepID=UPI001FD11715|nr:SigE family RNA polymerase sigma factor [Nocardioides sp. W7]
MSDDDGFEEFALARTPRLYRSAWLLCGDRHGAEDLVQETLAKVFVKWRRIDNPAAYAQTTLVRTFLSHRRRKSSRELPYADLPDVAGADPTDLSDLRLGLRDVLAGLAPIDRAVLVLRYSDDLSVEDVATRLGISAGAVRNRSMRALERARERTTR